MQAALKGVAMGLLDDHVRRCVRESRSMKEENVEERTINVPEIHCDHCKQSLERAVSAVAGVEQVQVNVEARTVAVRFDGERAQEREIEDVIEAQGYEVQR